MGILKRPTAPVRVCKVGTIVAGLDADDVQLVADMITEKVSFRQITYMLKGAGFSIGENSINLHFRGECICDDAPLKGAAHG